MFGDPFLLVLVKVTKCGYREKQEQQLQTTKTKRKWWHCPLFVTLLESISQ